MDDDFNDLLINRGINDPAAITALAAAADALTEAADRTQVARLVSIAHGQTVDRTTDEWFWRPFRDAFSAFPSDPAAIHGDVADACVRRRITHNDDTLAAVLSRLAAMSGGTSATPLLHPLAATALERRPPDTPSMTPLGTSTWEATALKGFPEDGTGAVQADVVRAALTVVIRQVKKAAVHADGQAGAAMRWANQLNSEREREVRCMEWLLAGRRGDGTRWCDLAPEQVAVGLAAELSAIVNGVPARRHELLLAQMLAMSGVETGPVDLDPDAQVPTPVEWLRPFVPMIERLAGGSDTPITASPTDVAQRLLWEHTAMALAAD